MEHQHLSGKQVVLQLIHIIPHSRERKNERVTVMGVRRRCTEIVIKQQNIVWQFKIFRKTESFVQIFRFRQQMGFRVKLFQTIADFIHFFFLSRGRNSQNVFCKITEFVNNASGYDRFSQINGRNNHCTRSRRIVYSSRNPGKQPDNREKFYDYTNGCQLLRAQLC